MGNDAPSGIESSRDMLQALAQYAPDAIRAISNTTPETAQKQLEVQRLTAPGYADLQNQIYRDYGPEANRIGSDINRANQLAASQTELDIARGPGRELNAQALDLQKQLDPEYYQTRGLINDAISKYLGSYSPTELSGSELEQISRGIAQTDGIGTPSNLRTIKNAQTFGDAGTKRWQNFGDAIIKASSALPGFKSGMSGFEIATRRPLQSNTGEGRLSSPNAIDATSAFNTNFGFANQALGEIGANQRTAMNKRKSLLDNIGAGAGIFSNVTGGLKDIFGS